MLNNNLKTVNSQNSVHIFLSIFARSFTSWLYKTRNPCMMSTVSDMFNPWCDLRNRSFHATIQQQPVYNVLGDNYHPPFSTQNDIRNLNNDEQRLMELRKTTNYSALTKNTSANWMIPGKQCFNTTVVWGKMAAYCGNHGKSTSVRKTTAGTSWLDFSKNGNQQLRKPKCTNQSLA